ncbi:hypothetical protein C427_0224 [Paraglaciecola psychrophila 170]|uniref:Uncharacterized protein n=1 Tax=Paraglaciecola psychrophila 170 TaxID=1129794 RepID=K6ZPK9_9ALTE|nr:hypothetical protein C427_0224 [Paraglaciecola psychrophila 170]GAC37866.1 hypothetical protein GPSY_2245 [Paraglaciecola psychrophila 170]
MRTPRVFVAHFQPVKSMPFKLPLHALQILIGVKSVYEK